MGKYVDAEKLIAIIIKWRNQLISLMNRIYYASNYKEWEAELGGYDKILSIIASLQQEQPELYKDESLGSPDYERGFKHGRDYQAEVTRKYTDKDKVVAYLVDKGYHVSTNGEIPTYQETFDIISNAIKHANKQGREVEKACDAYCKVCGHYPHTTPTYICRRACDYFNEFKSLLNAKNEEGK